MRSSSLVASRNYANRSQWQEKEKEQKTNAIYGERCFEQFKKLNPHTSSQKMYLVSRILMADWFSSRCALTWKMKGTKFSRLYFQLHPKTLRTEGIESGLLLPTPTCQDAKMKENSPSQQHKINELSIAVAGGSSSQLNPRFVAEMMGFPPNWTELPFQSGDQNQSKDTEMQ